MPDTPLLVHLRDQLGAAGATPGTASTIAFFGPHVSPELAVWADALGSEVNVEDGRLRPLDAPSVTNVIETVDGNHVARFRGLFAGLSFILLSDESGVLASWAPRPSGTSQTYDVHQDEWTLQKRKPSIGGALTPLLTTLLPAFVKAYGAADKATAKDKLDPALDPTVLWKATDWLVDVFLGISISSLDEALSSALPLKVWVEHKARLATWPQLANYWLVAHWAFGNDEALRETLELTANITHPATVELREWTSHGSAPEAVLRQRETLVAMAPAKALSPEAKRRRQVLETELKTEGADVLAARAALKDDPAATKALQLFAELQGLSSKDPYERTVYERVHVAIEEFAAAVDPRWLPILSHHQRLAARFIDSHALAIPGLVLALAKLSPDYETFLARVDEVGTSAFGLARQEEHAIAVGRFIADRSALAWLVKEANEWATRIDEWDVPVSPAYEHVLLEHALPETFDLIARVLSARKFHGGNWRICVTSAIAAGRLKAVPCLGAVRGALKRGLGREDNGERAAVEKAVRAIEAPPSL